MGACATTAPRGITPTRVGLVAHAGEGGWWTASPEVEAGWIREEGVGGGGVHPGLGGGAGAAVGPRSESVGARGGLARLANWASAQFGPAGKLFLNIFRQK